MLTDVWRNLNDEMGIYWKGRFDRVPSVPGVYAWFYPLRVTTRDLGAFVADLARVSSFDATRPGEGPRSMTARFAWEEVNVGLTLRPADIPFPPEASAAWKRAVQDPEEFERLRRVIMKGSLLMPPLYVGKTRSLAVRCQQHLAGTGHNDFHSRFETYAEQVSLQARSVNDLLFVCVRTGAEERADTATQGQELEGIVEEILKRACRPKYSVK